MSHVFLTLIVAALTASPEAENTLPTSLDLTAMRALPVQHDGRWPPLDTAARDVVESVTGSMFYQGHDPVKVLLGWTFDPQTWMQEPLIGISSAELRAELKLPDSQSVFSYQELIDHRPLILLIGKISRYEQGRKLDPLESKVGDINQKLVLLQQVFGGKVIRLIPDPHDALKAWQPITLSIEKKPDNNQQIKAAWLELSKAFLTDDGAAFNSASDQLLSALQSLPAAYRPQPERIDIELRYNRLRPFRLAWMVMAIGAVMTAGAMLIRNRWFDVIAIIPLITACAIQTAGLWLRWQIAGRIPAANMYESLLFLSWGMGVFAIISMFYLHHRIVPLTASAMGALALILADYTQLDHFIRPINPVLLDTIWMSIHVPIIMVSYAVLALAFLIAHVQLVIMAATPRQKAIINTIDSVHYWYVHVGSYLLLIGIITGSMWAASSWGRYWGWDPKEVWSLVAFLGYLTILHVRIDRSKVPRWAYLTGSLLAIAVLIMVVPKLDPLTPFKILALTSALIAMIIFVTTHGQFAAALKSALAFWLLIMTYVGVNYVLGIGLHAYGFGTGAVVYYLFLLGGIDLALITLCCVIYLARSG
ncbi:MAG: cytochrome c biogenesis protein, partial [Planctomycetota bacterium]